ncbi:MAG: WD40 repeat domain-containing protein [Planctomycetota bacterium]
MGRSGDYVWDTDTWAPVCALEGSAHTGEFSPDGERFAGRSEGNRLFVWDATTGGKLCEITGHAATICGCSFSPDGRVLLTYSHISHAVRPPMLPGDNTVRLWDAATGRQLAIFGGEKEPCTRGLFSPTRNEFAVVRASGILEVYDTATLRRTAVLRQEGPCVRSVNFSASGDLIVSVDDAREVRVHEIPSGRCALVLDGRDSEANHARFTADDTRIITYGWHTVIWDACDGKEVGCLRCFNRAFLSFDISPDCSRVAHEASRGERFADSIGIWHLKTESCLAFLDYWQVNGPIVWLPSGDGFLANTTEGLCLYRRRFPEWWWGHFYRPEVWAAILIGAAWLWTVARWARGRMRERRAAESGPTPASA